jgi:hypothetical protein
MAAQQELFTGEERSNAGQGVHDRERTSAQGPEPAPVWLQRMSLVVLVMFCFYIGALMAVLPWSKQYWNHNGWLMAHPAVEAILDRGWVRGVITGIGLIDIWIGVSEILHYRDYRR